MDPWTVAKMSDRKYTRIRTELRAAVMLVRGTDLPSQQVCRCAQCKRRDANELADMVGWERVREILEGEEP